MPKVKDFESNLDVKYVLNLGGMNQRQDFDKISDLESPLLVNISLDRPGTWRKRKGSDLLGSTLAGTGVDGLISYHPSTNTITLRKVAGGKLYTYNSGTDTWTESIASGFTSGTQQQAVNFLNRVYYISTDDFLQYESGGGTLTTVGSGADRIKGQAIGVAQDTLFVMSNDKVYYSYFNPATNSPTHQLWNTSEGSLANSTRFLNLLEYGKGLYSYQGVMYMWTHGACYRFDLSLIASGYTALQKVADIGLANPRAVTSCNGYLLWMSPDGRIWAYGGSGVPQPISWNIEDDSTGQAVINSLTGDNIAIAAAGSDKSKFYFSVGDTTSYGETVTNTVIVGHIPQSANQILWSLYSYPQRPMIFTEGRFGNDSVVMMGWSGTNDAYRMDVGLNDSASAISASAKTKFFDFGLTMRTKDCEGLYIKHKPQSGAETYLRLKYSIDGEFAYTTFSDPDDGTPVVKYGIVNMYNSSSSNFDEMDRINLPPGINFRNISIEMANTQANESFEITAIGFKVSPRTTYDKRIENI